MSLSEVLRALQGPWINLAAGVVYSFLLEMFPRFRSLKSAEKRIVVLAISVLVPLTAAVLACIFGYQPCSGEALAQAIIAGAMAFGGATGAHTRKLRG